MPAGNTYVSRLRRRRARAPAGRSSTAASARWPSATGDDHARDGADRSRAADEHGNVVGDLPETNTANNTATATVGRRRTRTPGRASRWRSCRSSSTRPGDHDDIKVTQDNKAVKGIQVRIKGPEVNVRTKASNAKGNVTQTLKMKKAGIMVFRPIASKRCNTKRVGVTNVFTPPVTG